MLSATPAFPAIILCTLNAKYIHASLGLRCLLANMGELRGLTAMREFTIARPAQQVVDELLATLGPEGGADQAEAGRVPASTVQIIGLGVYIWNVTQTCEVLRLLKLARPKLKIVLGGPEVSHEVAEQEIVRMADHVITGWGDLSFPKLCRALLQGPPPLMKIIPGEQPPLDLIALPYGEYSDADLTHRLLYVEASRGCPFKCEFCLSSLDQTARAFDLDAFLAQMQSLYQRGARNFKFVDRTFNLKIDASVRILQFFLDRLPAPEAPHAPGGLFVHFEVIPDHLPPRLKQMIALFPPGVLQFEVGIQSFSVAVQQRISRKQDNTKTLDNLRWLLQHSQAHVHADLIFGLPGETLQSFAQGFDQLHALGPHEIQLGMLKRLRGTPIARHSAAFGMVYATEPPYTVLQTSAVDAPTVQGFARFARYWDLIANSGRFQKTLALLLPAAPDGSAFAAFWAFSEWLWQSSGQTHGLTPERLVDALFDYLCTQRGSPQTLVREALRADYVASGARASPASLKGYLPTQMHGKGAANGSLAVRQIRHLAALPS